MSFEKRSVRSSASSVAYLRFSTITLNNVNHCFRRGSLAGPNPPGHFSEARADRESFNAALDACGRSGRVREAIDVLDAMRLEARSNPRLSPNQASYASAILACKTGRDSDTALALLERMKAEDRLKPEQRCVLTAVAACNAAGRGDEVRWCIRGEDVGRGDLPHGTRSLETHTTQQLSAIISKVEHWKEPKTRGAGDTKRSWFVYQGCRGFDQIGKVCPCQIGRRN